MAKTPNYDNMDTTQLRDVYLERCRQQGIRARADIPKTKNRLVQAIMEKDILLAVGNLVGLADHEDRYSGKQPILSINGGTN